MLSFQFNLRTCCCYLYSTICSLVFKNFDTITNMFRKTVLILIPFSCTPENTKKKKEYWSVNDSIRFDFELIADSDLFWVVFCFVEIVLLLQAKGKLRSSDNYSGSGAAAAPAAAVVAAVAAWKHIQEETRRAVGNAERELETQLTELKSLKRQRHCENRLSRIKQHALHATRGARASDAVDDCRAFGRLAVWQRHCRRRCEIVEQRAERAPNEWRLAEPTTPRVSHAREICRREILKRNLDNEGARTRQRTKVAGRECESEREGAGNGRRERKCAYDENFPRLVAAAQKRKTKTSTKPKPKTKGDQSRRRGPKQLHAVALCICVWMRKGSRARGERAGQGRAGQNVGLPVA